MAWFSRSPRVHLDPALAEELRRQHPEAGEVLAVGTGPRVVVAACASGLGVHRESGEGWQVVGWHMISRGAWKPDRQMLTWTFADGESDEVALDEPGRVPEVFPDRVRASIILEQHLDAPGGGQVVIAARRQLGGRQAPLVWQATTVGRARLSDPQVEQFVLRETARLRADYEL